MAEVVVTFRTYTCYSSDVKRISQKLLRARCRPRRDAARSRRCR